MSKLLSFVTNRQPMDLLFIALVTVGAIFTLPSWPGWVFVVLLGIEILRQWRKANGKG